MPTMKENPAEAQIASHRLMLRAGMIRQSSAGIYSWLPLGLRVLRNVVDGDLFAPAAASHSLRESLDISPTEVVLGFCGELRHKKGLPFLLSALAEVRQQRDACLLVIGEVRAREQ